ncbi:MAG: 1,4-alpha-glucan branching protein GlgB [Butyribacter sp.]|nr:1,4-alpha-glucan branching protein GlgB [bacterium]MDY3853967.1 1,4-alpha-glucan branching protein GlgB [Butyribacter sp.]
MQEKLDQWINWVEYDELLAGQHNAPHNLLGLHDFGKGQVFTVYRPAAQKVFVTDSEGNHKIELEQVEEGSGFFGLYVEGKQYTSRYLLHIQYGENDVVVTADPYSFQPQISSHDLYYFAEGKHYQIYEKLGAHPMTIDGVDGVYFAVWAPHARAVSVVGNFNMWDGRLHPMRTLEVSGVYELFIPGVQVGSIYKYQILTRTGDILMKSDPYANCAELRPNNASVVTDIRDYHWTDQKWMEARKQETRNSLRQKPMSVYEVHLGSWRKKDDGTEDGFYTYREMAPMLADYLEEMGYTHVELMGIAEHPFDGSWGYQVTGYYAPTRRYGDPQDFMYFVDYMHQRGISVILDWVPAHFPRDAYGLANFDGQPLYEHPDKRRGEHPHWGTLIFNYSKREVENFLLANGLFWLKKFHVDGLRVDAVASMLYLDYGKDDGEWLPNEDGGKENYDAIRLFRHMNEQFEKQAPGTMIIAEESTAWAGVTAPVELKGLGFLFKWNMGWMNDFLEYMKLDPYFRSFNHNHLTFSMQYAYSENFIQVLSHDEVVHGKCSMINKMPGELDDKFANLRTAYGFMYGHPGKKLLFMGQEFAQYREWSEERSLDWELLGEERNKQMQDFVKELNHMYQEYDALYVNDYDPMGFEWMSCENAEMSTVSFVRRGASKKNQLLFICNFTPVQYDDFITGVPCAGKYTQILSSDDECFGGTGVKNKKVITAKKEECDGKEYSLAMHLPPLSVTVYRFDYKE